MAPFFIGLLSVLLGIVSVLIVLIVLMQRPKQEGLGAAFGGGMTDQMFGAQTTNVLQKGTVYLAVMFFVFSLILSVLVAKNQRESSDVIEGLASGEDTTEETTPVIPNGSGATTPPIQIPANPSPAAEDPTPETKPVDVTPAPAGGEGSPAESGDEPKTPAE
ncbi:MAG: preprotein translocase subunit SecG [Pseudoalteromonas tetraodonis]|jgi:preprotein translocase subunit SecG